MWDGWPVLLGIAGIAISITMPLILGAVARDRTLVAMVTAAKEDARKATETAVGEVHERINRVRDEYVRRDDLDGHLRRFEKSLDKLEVDLKENDAKHERRYETILNLLEKDTRGRPQGN